MIWTESVQRRREGGINPKVAGTLHILQYEKLTGVVETKGRFTRYNFVACDMLTTSLRHELFRVNKTYNLLTIVVYDTKNVVGFWNMF